METQEYSSKTLDHLGLVAGMCREIVISEVIDAYCPSGLQNTRGRKGNTHATPKILL
jgi:hypothetical protein